MKKISFLFLLFLLAQTVVFSQSKFDLKDAVVVGLFNQSDERFQMEIMVSELLLQNGIKAKASLNYLKEGQDPAALSSDSLLQVVKNAGYDTYLLMAVRGYDKKFKPSTHKTTMDEELKLGHMFPIYKEGGSTVTFEFKFYRDNQLVREDLLKVSSPSKEGMLKKFRKQLQKKIKSNW